MVGATTDATWPVAQAVYADAGLRPGLTDAGARVLAGEPPKEGAPAEVRELAELRAQVKGDDAASRAILAEIARRTGARAIAVVSVAADGAVEVRVFDAASGELEGTRHRKEASGWSPFVGLLHGRFAATVEPPKPEPAPAPKKSGGSFYENPWFWVAIGGAAVAGVTVYALTRSDSTPAPVVLSWK